MSTKSCRARSTSVSRRLLREYIRVHQFAAVHFADGTLRDVLQGIGGVNDALAPINLIVTRFYCSLPSGNTARVLRAFTAVLSGRRFNNR